MMSKNIKHVKIQTCEKWTHLNIKMLHIRVKIPCLMHEICLCQ